MHLWSFPILGIRIGRNYDYQKRGPLAPAEREAIVDRYLRGEPSTTIAADFGFSPDVVLRLVRKAGGTVRRGRPLAPDERHYVLTHWPEDSAREIARALGHAGPDRVLAFLHGLGIETPNRTSRKHSVDHGFFKDLERPSAAHIAGYISADGCLSGEAGQRVNDISFRVQRADRAILEYINREMASTYPVRDVMSTPSATVPTIHEQSILKITSTELCSDLMALGIAPRKSKDLRPPPNLTATATRHFLRGSFEGDGGITRAEHPDAHVTWAGTQPFLEWVRAELSTNCGTSAPQIDESSEGGCYTLRYGGAVAVSNILRYLYTDAPFVLPTKGTRALAWVAKYGRGPPPRVAVPLGDATPRQERGAVGSPDEGEAAGEAGF